jgi:6-phosphofructo-2-kinase
MANQLAATTLPTALTSDPRSVPVSDAGRSYATTPVPAGAAGLSNPNRRLSTDPNGTARDGRHSRTNSASSGASSDAVAARATSGGHDALVPPPASLPSTQGPPAHSSSLAKALRAIHDGPGETSTRERPIPPAESPYTKSISSTAPGSPRIPPVRQNSGTQTPRVRPHATTLSIPGMTRSIISPDGKIADRDVAAKLVIIMVGLPARGKSYITKKIKRYLSWQQHDASIFNVGNRRRVAVGDVTSPSKQRVQDPLDAQVAKILLNGNEAPTESPNRKEPSDWQLDDPSTSSQNSDDPNGNSLDQSANFFDPKNASAFKIREQVAIDTLDELLDYLISGGGSVGILDATNSTIERRQTLFDHVKAREPKIGILFIESVCQNPDVSRANPWGAISSRLMRSSCWKQTCDSSFPVLTTRTRTQ